MASRFYVGAETLLERSSMAEELDDWGERPTDVSNLLNPAFVGAVSRRIVDGYVQLGKLGMPFELAFVAIPIVLHGNTRSALPVTTRTRFQMWLQDHRETTINFSRRAREIRPFVAEGIVFASWRRLLSFSVAGEVVPGTLKMVGVTKYSTASDEIKEIWSKSEFVGKWLADADLPHRSWALGGG